MIKVGFDCFSQLALVGFEKDFLDLYLCREVWGYYYPWHIPKQLICVLTCSQEACIYDIYFVNNLKLDFREKVIDAFKRNGVVDRKRPLEIKF